MKLIFKLIILALALETLASCESLKQFGSSKNKTPAPIDYLEKSTKIDIRNFFNGDLEGFAIVQDAQGKIDSSYTTKISGKWEDGRGNIQYNYSFNNGKKDSRTWLITINDSSSYSAIGHDFLETGHGRNQGNASVVNYSLNAIVKDKKQRVDFEDQLYLVDEKSAIIISTMRQSGSIVGKAIISLKKIN